ncbi:MAG: tRNA epoxyqueuosine(34) reductase QueG [Anaerolineales bacterium]|nr:tRNA epoxyqueuosine(34) reductase QueG [Anaerolineales bacterium]
MPETLIQAIKAEAARQGFVLAGVTTPDPPPHWNTYLTWLVEERHGQMAYLATERARLCRRDPSRLLPDCQSILVLGIPYPNPGPDAPEADSGSPQGHVAAYAWGEDYHLVLPERLKALVAFIEDRVGGPVANRWYTDTGPLLERDLAQRAGLGWIGKNTCLINPAIGSCFFLAEILLALDLEPDPPFPADRCGTCTRCIDACPTGCILPDRTIDARHCISYLTIENKGRIPPELRPSIGTWVFGCDICQMVCPWNRFAIRQADPAFAPRPEVAHPTLAVDMTLTPQDFNRKFRNSPIQRAKRRGYLRNVALALGNSRPDNILPALANALQDKEPLVRESAAWALENQNTCKK